MTKKSQIISLIVLAVVFLGILLSTAIFFRRVITKVLVGQVLQAGKPMQFGSYTVLVDKVQGNKLYGIKVSSKNKRLKAESGEYTYLPEKNEIKFNLINGAADDYDPANPHEFHTLTFKQSYFKIKLKSL
jgi:hypothetical protein